MTDVTSANTRLLLAIPGLYPVAQRIQNFATEDSFDTNQVEIAQVMMGVDGNLSGGVVPVAKPQTIILQPDSTSQTVFDVWVQAQDVSNGGILLPANETLALPAIGLRFTLTKGILTRYTPIPRGAKTLKERRFEIVWESIIPAPM